MELRCLETYQYGTLPRLAPKQAKDMGLDPKDYPGGPVMVYEAGETYDVEPTLARRLLRDHGPRKGQKAVRFEPVNSNDLLRLLMGDAERISFAEVMERGYVVAEDAEEKAKEVTVSA